MWGGRTNGRSTSPSHLRRRLVAVRHNQDADVMEKANCSQVRVTFVALIKAAGGIKLKETLFQRCPLKETETTKTRWLLHSNVSGEKFKQREQNRRRSGGLFQKTSVSLRMSLQSYINCFIWEALIKLQRSYVTRLYQLDTVSGSPSRWAEVRPSTDHILK